MPKRPHEESKEERWQRKMKKYEAKLKKKRLIVYSDIEENQFEDNPDIDRESGDRLYQPYEEPLASQIPTSPDSDEAVPVETPTLAEPSPPAEPTVPAEASGSSSADAAPTLDVDPELLKALGNVEEETTDWGEPIVDHIAMRLKPFLISGLKKEDKEILLKKYPFPKNLTLTKAPTLNAEISTMLSETNRNRDKRLYNKQNQLGAVLSGVTRAMSLLLHKEPKIVEILSILSDASKLLADSHFQETDTRRILISPLIDNELILPFKDRKRDEYLFGDNLGELVKNSHGIRKTGQLIQATPSANLNPRRPSSRGRQQKTNTNRGGGQQRQYRRRAAHPQQPAAQARRQPQPQAQAASRRPPPGAPSSAPRPTTTAGTLP